MPDQPDDLVTRIGEAIRTAEACPACTELIRLGEPDALRVCPDCLRLAAEAAAKAAIGWLEWK